jgi:16S rRNA (guanine527-N7)-methyltransferase
MKSHLITLLNDGLSGLDSSVLPESVVEHLILYLMEWKRWNKKINLTAESDALFVINKHIYESLQYTLAISPTGSLADIGSGAGFPGIPIKIILPKLEITLIESQRKRANFLKTAIHSIGLSGIQCIHGRVEDLPEFEEKYDFVTLRHVLEPHLSLKLGAGLLNRSGRLALQINCNNSFPLGFLDSLGLSLFDEIIFKRSSSAHSKIMVLKRKST